MRLHIAQNSGGHVETITQSIAERATRPSRHNLIRIRNVARIHINAPRSSDTNAHDVFAFHDRLTTNVIGKIEDTRKHSFPTLLSIGGNRVF